MTEETNRIFIAAHPRSGSTFLCKLLERAREVRVYLEIFHFDYDIIDQHLQGDLPFISQSMNLPADEKKARDELVYRHHEFVSLLQNINPDKSIAFKVFPKHLPDKLLGEVINESKLIVLLRRNLLQSYISSVISRKTQKWHGVDTSEERVEFNQADFVGHVRRVMDYYKRVTSLAEKYHIKLVALDYETLTISTDPIQVVSRALNGGLDHDINGNNGNLQIFKQDKRNKATEKILNAEEMMNYLEKFDLGMLNDGLVNCTDTDYARFDID